MKKIYLVIAMLFCFAVGLFAQHYYDRHNGREVVDLSNPYSPYFKPCAFEQSTPDSIIPLLEIPAIRPGDEIVEHRAYTLDYIEKFEQAAWVAYELTSEETNKQFERSNKFFTDPDVKTGSASDVDYKGSGYDRGHLAPAADMSFSEETMLESFYYSNMSPQVPAFNRGIWKRLEEKVRDWAVLYQSIYVVTGPVLSEGNIIATNGVAVPNYFYKVILDYHSSHLQAIGFIMRNEGAAGDLKTYAVTVDSVENLTGIDFFPRLPNNIEKSIEGRACLACWDWNNSTVHHSELKNKNTSGASVQCHGITKAGSQCKKMTRDVSGFCYLHQAQAGSDAGISHINESHNVTSSQCLGTTKKGSRCRRMTRSPNGYCYQHGGN
ncbi:MAG: DNA/RNA non-specific endonuclease [Bacteroidota bacterium]